MKKQIIKLIDLKSIITLVLVISLVGIVFGHVNINDEAVKTLFVSMTSSVFTYYFTHKKDNEDTKENI